MKGDGVDEAFVLEGLISIQAVLEAGSRPVEAIFVREDKRDRQMAFLERLAVAHEIPLERMGAGAIDQRAGGQSHGGVIAMVGPRRFQELDDLLADDGPAFVAMLDGIEDPFNFGQAIRALYAAGVNGVVVRPRNWTTAAAVVARASAGASERVLMAVAETALDAAEFFRARGLTVATTALKNSVSVYEADLAGPLFLLVGGEKRGITRSFLAQADLLLSIPYGRPFGQSLGVTAATAVLAFEVMRQRAEKTATNYTNFH